MAGNRQVFRTVEFEMQRGNVDLQLITYDFTTVI